MLSQVGCRLSYTSSRLKLQVGPLKRPIKKFEVGSVIFYVGLESISQVGPIKKNIIFFNAMSAQRRCACRPNFFFQKTCIKRHHVFHFRVWIFPWSSEEGSSVKFFLEQQPGNFCISEEIFVGARWTAFLRKFRRLWVSLANSWRSGRRCGIISRIVSLVIEVVHPLWSVINTIASHSVIYRMSSSFPECIHPSWGTYSHL